MKHSKSTFLKVLSVSLFTVMSTSLAHALVDISAKGGLSLSSQAASNSGGTSINDYSSAGIGYLGGLGVDIGLGPVGVLVDVLYARRSYEFGAGSLLNNSSIKVSSLHLPVQARFSIIPMLSLTAGVYYAMVLGDGGRYNSSGDKVGTVAFSGAAASDFGLVGGVGVALPLAVTTLSLEARYNYGLKNTSDSPVGDASTKNRSIDLLVGVTF